MNLSFFVMSLRRFVVLIATMQMAAGMVFAQGYEADSVYYTPIPAKTAGRIIPRAGGVFGDTLTESSFIRYYFNVGTGAMIGCWDCEWGKEFSFSLSTVHGVSIGKKLRVGGGMGFEAYSTWQTVPFFGNVSFDVFGTRNAHALFIQSQLGWAKGWHDVQPQEWNLVRAEGGRMYGAQLGYRIKYHDLQLAWLVGFRHQTVSTYFEYPNQSPDSGFPDSATPNTRTVTRQMERFMMTMSIGWK